MNVFDATEVTEAALLDDFIRGQQNGGRNFKAKRLCGLEVDHQIELGRLLDRKIGRLGAFENFIDVVACTPEPIGYIGTV